MAELRFDWHAPIDSPQLTELAATLVAEANSARSSRGLSTEGVTKRAIEEAKIARLLLTSLYNGHFTLPEPSKVALPLTAATYASGSQDPLKISLSYRSVKQFFDALKSLGWIGVEPGKEGKGYTRMWATGALKGSFDSQGLRWHKQQPFPKETLVVLRDRDGSSTQTKRAKRKVTLVTPETDEVENHRDSLFNINEFLTQHCVSLDLTDDLLGKLATEVANSPAEGDQEQGSEANKGTLDFSKVQLRRIFSRGDMEKGGRFYGGWWQSLPSLYRPHITIDGLKTCEVDYSAIALRIIYAEEGHPYPVEQDPYDVGLSEWEGTNDPRRKHVKTFVNAMLNDESGRYRLPKEEQESIGVTHDELAEAVSKRHASISHLFGTGIGLRAQYIDSQLAERLMLHLMHEGIVVLPIHDSFIVRAGYEQWLKTAMVTVFEELTGGKATVTADGSRLAEHFGLTKKDFDSLSTEPEHNIVRGSDTWALISNRDSKIMDRYVGSWKEWQSSQ